MFSAVDKVRDIPIIYIKKWNEEKITPPANYYDFFKSRNINPDFLYIHDLLVRFVEVDMKDYPEKVLGFLDGFGKLAFKGADYVEYDIRYSTIDFYDFFKNREIKNEKLLFEKLVYKK